MRKHAAFVLGLGLLAGIAVLLALALWATRGEFGFGTSERSSAERDPGPIDLPVLVAGEADPPPHRPRHAASPSSAPDGRRGAVAGVADRGRDSVKMS